MKNTFILVLCITFLLDTGCDNNVLDPNPKPPETTNDSLSFSGTGTIKFTQYTPLADKPINIYFHIPKNANSQSPVLICLHGAGRDGFDTRAAFIKDANELGIIIIAPTFSEDDFPGGDAYNLGNVFVDGDNPTPSSLNDESIWTFSAIDPIFNYFTNLINCKTQKYDLFGHSAGGQFVHRMVMLKPRAKFNRIVSASSGWYMMPDKSTTFPYGLKSSPAENLDLSALFFLPLHIVIGEADNDPDYPGLRHNTFADAQGLDRLSRAKYFYNKSSEFAQNSNLAFNWKFQSLPKVGHDINATSTVAITLLYR